ncbi:MAG: hypothetical protein DMG27_01700 [Acidobacteria bacterium]|nr:MAG: hypothetical protein DMG27_01700 [Acidobacteriota bacterium]
MWPSRVDDQILDSGSCQTSFRRPTLLTRANVEMATLVSLISEYVLSHLQDPSSGTEDRQVREDPFMLLPGEDPGEDTDGRPVKALHCNSSAAFARLQTLEARQPQGRSVVDVLLLIAVTLTVSGVGVGGALVLPAGAAASTSFESALRKLDETELAGIRKREVKFVDAVYAPDVVMFPVYGPFKVEGLDRVREAWRSLYDTFTAITRCEWSERRYHASGPASAWMTCLWSLEGTNNDGQQLEVVLRVTRQYKRRRGRWVVVHEHLSAAMR